MDVTLSFAAEITFYVLLLVFTLHAFFLGYHWFTYGEKKRTGEIALVIYLIGAALFFITLALLLKNLNS